MKRQCKHKVVDTTDWVSICGKCGLSEDGIVIEQLITVLKNIHEMINYNEDEDKEAHMLYTISNTIETTLAIYEKEN